ncbi:Spc7-domain-containing protein [Aureobasidium sp. EXF-3400]|nr:Spc7-domain-containing protein [Aureobasidium sp. EXF-12344]KAI4768253.1 Spc7-domain-containing protein [Aureobasidium sp. EXF-3400]
MIDLDDKENQSPLRLGFGKSPSPKRSRTKNIAPAGQDSVPPSAVKSILPSKEDEAKRREARRKSLANRRVSFAPEATLHTWDVIEYMRDATASSNSSDHARAHQQPDSDPPSTPPSQADDDQDDLPQSPEHQRDAHQQKRRRSSAIPPMNFNDLDDYSSSPVSGSSNVEASSDIEENVESEDDGDSTAMSLDQGDNTLLSQQSGESTGSSARLDAALQQAATQAGTRGIDFDEYGDMSMEMAGDEVTNAFKPWAQGQHFAVGDENSNPFDSVFRPGPQPGDEEDEEDDDMSMDMTRAVGRILPQQQPQDDQEETEDEGDMTMDMTKPMGTIWTANQPQSQPQEQEEEEDETRDMTMDMTRPVGRIIQTHQNLYQQSPERTVSFGDETMDLTQAVGKIHQWNPQAQPPRSALKRRFESFATEDVASPSVKKPLFEEPTRRTVAQARDAKRRRSSSSRQSLGDATMDLTVAVGAIQQRQQSPVKKDRRLSSRSRRSSGASSIMDEQTMDFTMAVGGIKQQQQPKSPREPSILEEDDAEVNEDMSMEFTAVVGNILKQHAATTIERPATPRKSPSPTRTEIPTTPKDQDRFKETRDLAAKKLLTPLFEKQVPGSAVKDSAGSRRSSARKSASEEPTTTLPFLSPAVFAIPHRSPASARKSPSAQRTPSSAQKTPMSAQKIPSSARKTPVSATKSPHFAQKISESAQHTPLAQTSPVSAKQNGSAKKLASVHKSPISAARTPASVTKSPLPKASSRKSPVSTRRSARISLAAVHPHQDEQAEEIVPTLTKPEAVAEPADEMQVEQHIPEPEQEVHDEPMAEVSYPTLPVITELEITEPETEDTITVTPRIPEATTTPQITEIPSAPSPVHHHTAVSMAGSPTRSPDITTPKQIDLEELNPTSPSLEKQLRSSPVKFAATPEQQKQYAQEPRSTFADSIKYLSTPSKEIGTSPLKRLRALTPKKSPAKKMMTPKKIATPKLSAPFIVENKNAPGLLDLEAAKNIFAVPKTGPPARKVQLNDFLDLAGIKFMDLTASKRRHTVAPTPSETHGADGDDQNIDLEGAVVAGACTMPMLDLFQHACRELKKYISEGKSFLKTLEAEVYDDPPPFFQAYMDATPDRKSQLDVNMRDAKTNARMRSKEIWYDWRSKLLDGLSDGLDRIRTGLDADAEVLGQKQQSLDSVLPELLQHYEDLLKEAEQLEQAAAATSEEEKEELRASRARLVEVDEQIEERKRMLASLQRDVDEQDNLAEAYEEGKMESLAAIQEAERVKESCRGFTVDEVQSLKGMFVLTWIPRFTFANKPIASVAQLEKQTGWAIASASGANLTMTYKNTLQLYFNTTSFKVTSSAQAKSPTNSPISLTHITPASPTTEKRFFLQLMRAQLQCLDQNTISVKQLLGFVQRGWDTASLIAEQVRCLTLEQLVNVSILSDERLAIDVCILLPKVETKVKVGLRLTATLSDPEADDLDIKHEIDVDATVVYGEPYNEKNMSEFVGKRVRGQGSEGWDATVRELKMRLVATGRKGR